MERFTRETTLLHGQGLKSFKQMFQRNFHISAKCQLNENQQQIKQLGESRLGEKVALRMAVRAKRLWELWIPSVTHTGVPAELKNKKKSAGLYSTLSIVCFVCQVYSSSFNVCFGNDFLAISVCIHLRPQTRLSEVSHKWKFVLLFSSFSKRECSCLVFMPFQQALRKWKHQLSHPGTETGKQTSILKTQTQEAKQAAQQCLLLTGAIPGHAVDQLWITYAWAVAQLWMSYGSAVNQLWMLGARAASLVSTTQPRNAHIPVELIYSLPQWLRETGGEQEPEPL